MKKPCAFCAAYGITKIRRIENTNMDYLITFGIIALAALIHASFQLSVSMMTLLSGHAIGHKSSFRRTMRLASGFTFGNVVMVLLMLTFISYLSATYFGHHVPAIAWAVVSGLLIGLGVAVWAFYYRKGRGTTLWLPRHLAVFLNERTKSTKSSAETFSLGMTSVIAEGLFIIPTMTAAAFALVYLPTKLQLAGILLYLVIASIGLVSVVVLIGSGHKLSSIQRWREDNKRFLQFAAGSGLIILGAYIYANEVVTAVLAARGGM